MIYQARINKRVRNVRVYLIQNRIGPRMNILTRFFIKLFGQEKRFSKGDGNSANEKLM